eukprot:77239-Chlamydomonas_euryale.AAC.1
MTETICRACRSAVEDNNDGWGPSAVPERLKDVPFAPFSKGDKIGRAADWNASAYQKYPGEQWRRGGLAVAAASGISARRLSVGSPMTPTHASHMVHRRSL